MSLAEAEAAAWPQLVRELRAIVAVDLVESVLRMEEDEEAVIQCWIRFVHGLERSLAERGGRLVKSTGDGMLLDFSDLRAALAVALEMDRQLAQTARGHALHQPLKLRVGLHRAPVVVDRIDIFGTAVNLTARLASLAGPGEVVASAEVVGELVNGLDADVEDMGECYLKHIAHPVRAFRLAPTGRLATIASELERPHADELQRPRLAVLNLAADAAATPLGSLVADELAASLAAHASVDLISRMTTRHAAALEPGALLDRLHAHYAIGGTCVRSGSMTILTIELSYVPEQRVVWVDTLRIPTDALVADPAPVLAEVSARVMSSIEAHETGRIRGLPLASLESYSLLIGGLRLMHRLSRADFTRARELFETLVARHPRHPDGYAWLAKWHILNEHQGWTPDSAASAGMARDMARRALDLDDGCAVALIVAGMARMFNDRRLDEAEAIYQSTLAMHPNEALAWLLKGMVHAFRGEGELAVQHTRRASALSPLDPMRYYYDSLGASAEAAAGRYDDAIALARRSLSANALHGSTLRILTIAHAMRGEIEQARQAAARLLALEPEFTVSRFRARSPSSDYEIGRRFADALARAGVPP